jgi:hypothetical protein
MMVGTCRRRAKEEEEESKSGGDDFAPTGWRLPLTRRATRDTRRTWLMPCASSASTIFTVSWPPRLEPRIDPPCKRRDVRDVCGRRRRRSRRRVRAV